MPCHVTLVSSTLYFSLVLYPFENPMNAMDPLLHKNGSIYACLFSIMHTNSQNREDPSPVPILKPLKIKSQFTTKHYQRSLGAPGASRPLLRSHFPIRETRGAGPVCEAAHALFLAPHCSSSQGCHTKNWDLTTVT